MNKITKEQVIAAFECDKKTEFDENTIVYCCNAEHIDYISSLFSYLEPHYTARNCHTWNGKTTDKIVCHKDGRTSWTSAGGACFDFWITKKSYFELYGEHYQAWKNPSPLKQLKAI